MTHDASAQEPHETTVWEDAPCGLARIDSRLRVTDANSRFLELTGRARADLVEGIVFSDLLAPAGRIMFESQLAPMLRLNGVVDEILLDVKHADGKRIPVLLNARTIDDTGTALVVLMPVPDRLRYEQLLRESRAAADNAVMAGDAVRRRLEFLAHAGQALASSTDVGTALTRLAQVLVDETADWCLIYANGTDGRPELERQWAAADSNPGRLGALQRFAELMPPAASPGSSFRRVLDGGEAVLLNDLKLNDLQAATTSAEVAALLVDLDVSSAMVVPSAGPARQSAVLVLGRSGLQDPFTDDDLSDLTDLAARASIAIDNLELYAHEHSVAVALQQALLTMPPVSDRFEIETRYLPGVNGNEVGGDWYDAFFQPDGTLVIAIGDVMGHDIKAAGSMGQLRGVIRTVGYAASGTAARILAVADRTTAGLKVNVLATAVVGRLLDRSGDDTCTFEWSNAGHPPPVLIRADGDVVVLDRRNDLLLGVRPEAQRHDETIDVVEGDTLLLYSDGLVERRDESMDDSVARLVSTLTDSSHRTLAEICTTVLDGRPAPISDDIALIAVRVSAGRIESH